MKQLLKSVHICAENIYCSCKYCESSYWYKITDILINLFDISDIDIDIVN